MLSPFQKLIASIPLIFIIVAIITTFITQRIWNQRNYTSLFILSGFYILFSLWVFNFDFSQFGFKASIFPLIFLCYCLLFEKVFTRIKPKDMNRRFPIYIVFGEWDETWDKKLKITPERTDRIVSTWLSLSTVFTTVGLMYIF